MNYEQALKKVQAKKTKENYFVFTLAYDSKLVLPHKDGIILLTALQNAEFLHDPYNGKQSIAELPRDKIQVNQMSQEEYEQFKIAALLDITVAEVKEQKLLINKD